MPQPFLLLELLPLVQLLELLHKSCGASTEQLREIILGKLGTRLPPIGEDWAQRPSRFNEAIATGGGLQALLLAGAVVALHVKAGDKVRAGQELLRIDARGKALLGEIGLEHRRQQAHEIIGALARLVAVEAQRRVGLEEMVMRANLNGAITAIGDAERQRLAAFIHHDVTRLRNNFTRNNRIRF